MYVRNLTTDKWHDTSDEGRDIGRPTWADIEAAIRQLDGRVYTLAIIGGEGEAHLAVGGGSEGRYIVYATFDNWNFRTLTSAATESSKIYLFIGGQEGDYPSNIVVSLQSALQAARTFAELGQIDASLSWRDH
jgi:hypothetical protein